MKFRLFGVLKGWFRKPAEPEAETEPKSSFRPAVATPSGWPKPQVPLRPHFQPKPVIRTPVARAGMSLPLEKILAHLPPELQLRVNQTYVAGVDVCLPIEHVLPQLAHGAVRISFGELRRLTPPGTFSDQSDRDELLVPLPLAEILARINPALLTRRPAQTKVEVPENVTGPFCDRGQGLIFSVAATRPDAVTPTPVVRTRRVTPPPAAPVAPPARPFVPAVPTVPQPSTPRPVAPAAIPVSPPPREISPTRQPPPVATPAPQTSPANGNGSVLIVSLSDLARTWPDAVRREIMQLNLFRASVTLPMPFLDTALKGGKIAFTWRQLRSWIQPPPANTVSVNDPALLELPLNLIAPLFLARQQMAKAQKKAFVDQTIPNLFFTGGKPDVPDAVLTTPPAATAPKPADTNYYVWGETADTPVDAEVVFKRGTSTPGTAFLRRYATPNEIVSKAAALDGVAGAIIALPDGLLVANRIPPELNGDTLAAFLPQIFGRVSQCTNELRMGNLNNLSFTVGNVPWKIFRIGAIFFAAFGRAGEPLPSTQLAGLAAELDRNPQT